MRLSAQAGQQTVFYCVLLVRQVELHANRASSGTQQLSSSLEAANARIRQLEVLSPS